MAYLDHIDPGNAGGSVPVPSSPFPPFEPHPITYSCPYHKCGASFVDKGKLQSHRIEMHPLKRPYMLIHDLHCSDSIVIKHELKIGDIAFQDVEQVSLDGVDYVDTSKVLDLLISNQSGRYIMDLKYQSYVTTIDLTFKIISQEELEAVEYYFYRLFDSDSESLSPEHLLKFNKDIQSNNLRNEYAGGISCYLAGILAKERDPDTSIPYEKFIEKFGEADDKLTDIHRILAQTLIQTMSFSSNNFLVCDVRANSPALESASKFMRTGEFGEMIEGISTKRRFPTDTMTEFIVNFCSKGNEYREQCINDIESLYKQDRVGEQDRQKLIFCLLVYYLNNSDINMAVYFKNKLNPNSVIYQTVENLMSKNDE